MEVRFGFRPIGQSHCVLPLGLAPRLWQNSGRRCHRHRRGSDDGLSNGPMGDLSENGMSTEWT
jgi:hypothetical protein